MRPWWHRAPSADDMARGHRIARVITHPASRVMPLAPDKVRVTLPRRLT